MLEYNEKKRVYMKSLNILAIGVALLSSATFAQFFDLPCVPGDKSMCTGKHCANIRFVNEVDSAANISGQLRAKLSGAAKLFSNGKFEIQKKFPARSTHSCYIDMTKFYSNVRQVDVNLTYNGTVCNHFLPKSQIGSGAPFTIKLQGNKCVITR